MKADREIERRAFLSACGAVVLALSGCQSVLARTRLARLTLDDPHPDAFLPVLRALIETILPFDHPHFPAISSAVIEARLLTLFPLEDRTYLVFQKGLVVFNEVDLFPVLQGPIVFEERALLEGCDGDTLGVAIAERGRHDERLYAEFQLASAAPTPRPFTALDRAQRGRYLRLWGQSAFNSKQVFYHAAKRLVMVTAYSGEDFWRVIGYAGPLLPRRS
jgi:hypothetical protein